MNNRERFIIRDLRRKIVPHFSIVHILKYDEGTNTYTLNGKPAYEQVVNKKYRLHNGDSWQVFQIPSNKIEFIGEIKQWKIDPHGVELWLHG